SLNLHVHLHTCALDGVYVEDDDADAPRFVPAAPPIRAELYVLTERSARRTSRCRIMSPVECIARLCALVPPPRYPLTRFHGVLAPRAKLRHRVVPKMPEGTAAACPSSSSRNGDKSELRRQPGGRPPPRDRSGPVVPTTLPVSATPPARTMHGAG